MVQLLVSTRSTLTTLVTLVSYPPVVAMGRWDTEILSLSSKQVSLTGPRNVLNLLVVCIFPDLLSCLFWNI